MLTVDTFNATSGNDVIEISATATITTIKINSTVFNSAASDIFINAGAGNDTFRALSTRTGVIIRCHGDDGNDIMENPVTRDLDAVYKGPAFFFGGAGTDTYFANNQDDSTAAATIDISYNGITKTGFGAISNYDEIEVLEFRDSDGSNRISFTNLQTPTREVGFLRIFANGGNDTITNIYSTDTFGFWSTALGTNGVYVDGGSGTDTLILNNHNGGAGNHTLTAATISVTAAGSDAGSLTYAGVEAIDFDVTSSTAGLSNDIVTIAGKPAGTSLNFDAGDGNDQFIVGNGDLDSNGWQSVTLAGGKGTDSIIFDDELDTSDDGTSSTYTFANQLLTKGTQAVTYTGFESQILKSANGFVSGFNVVPVVNINATSSLMQSTTITGGAARGCTVNVGVNDLNSIAGVINVNTLTSLTVNDTTNTLGANVTYEINSSQVSKTSNNQTINYSAVGSIVLNASNQPNAISVTSVPVGTSITINANGGNDTLTLGQGNIGADIRGPVTLNGGAGGNSLTLNNSTDSTPATQALNATTFVDGLTHTYSGITSRIVNTGPGGTTLAVNVVNVPTTINGGSGDDLISIGGGSLLNNLTANATVNGGGGNDELIILGQDDTSTNATFNKYAFPSVTQFRFGDTSTGKIITYGGLEQATLQSSQGNDDIDVSAAAIPLRISSNGGNDSVIVAGPTAPVTINTGPETSLPFGFRGGDSFTVGGILGTGSVVIDQNDTVLSMGVSTGSTLRLANGAILNKAWPSGFFIDFGPNLTGTLDLGSGALLWRDGGGTGILPDFRGLLTRGRNNGSWNGTSANGAINSSLAASSPLPDAVGYGLGSEIAISSIGGFNIAPGDTLLRYTFYGDADLNGVVNFDDYSRTDTGFLNNRTGWVNGDFNYDNVINFDDYSLIDLAFNSQGARRTPTAPATTRVTPRDGRHA